MSKKEKGVPDKEPENFAPDGPVQVIKTHKGVPSVIIWGNRRYVYDPNGSMR